MGKPGPRVLMSSHRLLEPHVSWASAYEFEDAVCAIDDVELACVSTTPRTLPQWQRSVLARLRKRTGFDVNRDARRQKIEITGDYDLFFTRVMTPVELDVLDSLPGWQERCRIKVCWVEELWVNWLEHTGLLKRLEQFDHVFVGHAPTPEPLSKLIGPPCSFLSFGVDALRFCPHPKPPERTIDYYAMGRRSPETHRRLLQYANERESFTYLYDSARPTTFVEDHVGHRALSASLIQRSRYFMADRAKANDPSQTKGGQVFGPRFFEGAAAGAVMIGEPPVCDTFDAHFDWPDAVIPLKFGSTNIGEVIDALDADPARIERARIANMAHTLRRHDWLHRWKQVLGTVGLDPLPAARQREEALLERAANVEASSGH